MWLETAATVLGGVGVFLIGMTLLSRSLTDLGGESLRRLMGKVTRGRTSSVATGAVVTALLQSSSATTLATIGFVSAGLLTLSGALGVIFGSNLGTTATSWLVSLLGLKVDISAFALPLTGVGALVHVIGRKHIKNIGSAAAGFGLIFVGIDLLQQGFTHLAASIDLSAFSSTSWGSWAILVVVGAVMTVLMQSSSAAVASTLVAVGSGAIDLEGAAALVIGQNVGTTVTAAIGSIGATISARRAAAAHIGFNLVTGLLAFAALPWLVDLVEWLGTLIFADGFDSATALALFHTIFNLMGVLLFAPWTEQWARLLKRLITDKGARFTTQLDDSTLPIPAVAVEAAHRRMLELLGVTAATFAEELRGNRMNEHFVTDLEAALQETRDFVASINSRNHPQTARRLLGILHATEHLSRMAESGAKTELFAVARQQEAISAVTELLVKLLEAVSAETQKHDQDRALGIADLSRAIAKTRQVIRKGLLERAAEDGAVRPIEADETVRALQWMDGLGYYAWRAITHLNPQPAPSNSSVTPKV